MRCVRRELMRCYEFAPCGASLGVLIVDIGDTVHVCGDIDIDDVTRFGKLASAYTSLNLPSVGKLERSRRRLGHSSSFVLREV